MIAIELRFPAGRYHATGWDHHVNEGTVEWPPAPWRILRAMVAVAHRLAEPPPHDELVGLLLPLTELPTYELPEWTEGHIRTYQPLGDDRTTKVFDAFVLPDRDASGVAAPLVVRWPDAELGPGQGELLDRILDAMGYLGRSESWVLARRIAAPPPGVRAAAPVADSEAPGAFARLPAVVPPADFRAWRTGFLTDRKLPRGVTVPETWFDALTQDTATIFRAGWSSPPGMRWVRYSLPRATTRRRRAPPLRGEARPTVACLALGGAPLPRLTDAVRIGDVVRRTLLRRSDDGGGSGSLPAFSGRGADGERLRGHDHAYVLPGDADADGHIDHVLVCTSAGSPLAFDSAALAAIESIDRLWEDGEREWPARVVAVGSHRDLGGLGPGRLPQCGTGRVWQSLTPFVPSRHPKRRGGREVDGVVAQMRRELDRRGLPSAAEDVAIEPTAAPPNRASPVWRQFRLLRSGGGSAPAVVRGFGARLTFREPVTGPVALGYAAHQGLGQFVLIEQ